MYEDTQDSERRTVEDHAKAKGHAGTQAWKFAAAKAFKSWPEGAEVTEAEYDAAVTEASNLSFGYDHAVPK